MERTIIKQLKAWKESPFRKPLILSGARQVGNAFEILRGFQCVQAFPAGCGTVGSTAEENLRSKSLRTFVAAHPDLYAIRFSMSPYMEQEWMKNVPLYGVGACFSHLN